MEVLKAVRLGGPGKGILPPSLLYASATYDPASAPARGSTSASPTTTLTVTSAALGDPIWLLAHDKVSTAGLILAGCVTAADVVGVVLENTTAAAIDVASGTLRVWVAKRARGN